MNRLYLPVVDQYIFIRASRSIIKVRNDLSQMNIQIFRYTSVISNHYLAVYVSTQVNDGSNLRIITDEVNGERDYKIRNT